MVVYDVWLFVWLLLWLDLISVILDGWLKLFWLIVLCLYYCDLLFWFGCSLWFVSFVCFALNICCFVWFSCTLFLLGVLFIICLITCVLCVLYLILIFVAVWCWLLWYFADCWLWVWLFMLVIDCGFYCSVIIVLPYSFVILEWFVCGFTLVIDFALLRCWCLFIVFSLLFLFWWCALFRDCFLMCFVLFDVELFDFVTLLRFGLIMLVIILRLVCLLCCDYWLVCDFRLCGYVAFCLF